MICRNCGNEVGNMEQCPYCGVQMHQNTMQGGGQTTVPVQWKSQDLNRMEDSRHIRNMDRWNLIQIILIAGIFIIELLQLIVSIA